MASNQHSVRERPEWIRLARYTYLQSAPWTPIQEILNEACNAYDGLLEQLEAARAHPQPEELREAWEAIKSDMSREAFVPWAEGMIRTLDALQAQLDAAQSRLDVTDHYEDVLRSIRDDTIESARGARDARRSARDALADSFPAKSHHS